MHSLPEAGGILDQNWILMRQFLLLKKAEREKAKWDDENNRQREMNRVRYQ